MTGIDPWELNVMHVHSYSYTQGFSPTTKKILW
jgi:hypothetical protein